jgi:tetratricopeptide (TPR) repeat protein
MEHGIFLYRETQHVPFIVKLPGGDRAGSRVAAPVQHIDLVPTILDKVRAPLPSGLRGRSLVPIFTGGTIPEAGLYAEALYSRYHFGWSELYALTDARYRFIRAPKDELYDSQEDAAERRNVAPERESVRIAMRQALERLMAGAKIDAPATVTAEDREQLKALGYVSMQSSVGPGTSADSLPDPKDKIAVLEKYRQALELVRANRMSEAIAAFQAIVADNPAMADVWAEIAGLLVRQGRLEEAVVAYKRLVETAPYDPAAIVSVAQVLLELGRLDEAKAQAEMAVKILPASEGRWRATAHKMLMRVALAKKDPGTARAEAKLAEAADPTMPLTEMVEGLISYEAADFARAAPHFDAALRKASGRTFDVPDLHFYLGDSYARLERYAEAEPLLKKEIELFPSNVRARAGLAMLYRVQDRNAESAEAIAEMLRVSPTPESYATAEKLWAMFGEPQRAAAVKAEGQRIRRAAAAPAK